MDGRDDHARTGDENEINIAMKRFQGGMGRRGFVAGGFIANRKCRAGSGETSRVLADDR
jgi:hypothetical protein